MFIFARQLPDPRLHLGAYNSPWLTVDLLRLVNKVGITYLVESVPGSTPCAMQQSEGADLK